jgi:TRAP-type C4-dicarboxylate transport system permease small subunit
MARENWGMLARVWDKGLAAIVATSYVTIVIVGFSQVLFRFAFHISLAWSEEVVRYVFIWSVFFTAALAFNLDTHIVIDFMTTWYPPRLKRIAALISWAFVIGGLIILLVLGIQLIQAPSVRFQKSPAMEIPMTIPYAAIPIGSFLMLVNAVRAAWRTWKGVQAATVHVEAA